MLFLNNTWILLKLYMSTTVSFFLFGGSGETVSYCVSQAGPELLGLRNLPAPAF
jgi:hypothetical protein